MPYPFHIVNVFAEERYTGNQLAVVLNADGISEAEMLHIAQDMNFSETTFVRTKADRNGSFHVRMFTPTHEVAFGGHPILGTAWVIRNHVQQQIHKTLSLSLPVGQIPVSFEMMGDGREVPWFEAPLVTAGKTIKPELVANVLQIKQDDIDSRAPVQVFSAGVSAIVVPLRNLDALKRSSPDMEGMNFLKREGLPQLIYLFCPGTRSEKNQLSARFFFMSNGVREDPATGNAASFLGVYLLEHQYFNKTDLTLRIEQGYEINRPSLVMLRAQKNGSSYEIHIGGSVIPTVRGELG
ncbi:MAG: PhzF family phenazine biosynthesis protein [Ignavibacteriae bacterium]|nr:PhzF family phenazine biosynthesis protein [Ignavibacteriota bacterium]